nr:hypothetical protein [uncultured Desulfobacter sp.]
MGFANFKAENDYIKISVISHAKNEKSITGVFNYYDSKGGDLITTIGVNLNRDIEVEAYISNKKSLLTVPVYPQLCSERDAMEPMWTVDSTDEEKEEYDTALAAYESDKEIYNSSVSAIEKAAETDNIFDAYFSKSLLYSTSNIEKCFYTWAKTLPFFAGVTDVLESENE